MITHVAKLLVPTNKSHFRLYDDPDFDNWKDYMMDGEKVTIYDKNLVFESCDKFSNLRRDVLKVITDYIFNSALSPDAKPSFILMMKSNFIFMLQVKL